MAHSSNFRYGEDSGYVDIHGNDIRVFVCEKTGQILVPINELKGKGFRIYCKNQYNRLLIDDSQFVHEFDMFLLQCAQSYMLKNQINFKENEILESINKVKRRLTEGSTGVGQNTNNTTNQFMKDHRIEKSVDEDNINITSEVKKEPQKHVLRSPRSFNNNSHNFQRPSPDQMSDKSDDSRGGRNPRSRPFENKSFDSDQNKNRANRSFENGYKTDQDSKSNSFGAKQSNGYGLKPRNSFNQNKGEGEDEIKMATAELDKPQHEVLVVFVEKPGIMWVQDVDNFNTVESIAEKIKKEVEHQKPATRLDIRKVYLAQQDNEWFRCKPIKFKPATVVFFLDYGNTDEVNVSDCKEISSELAAIPAQAIKVSYDENKYTATCGDIKTVKVNRKVGKGTYSVDVCEPEEKISPQRPEVAPSKTLKVTIPTYFDKPKPLCALENGHRVIIINEAGGKLALRTKECYDKLKQIERTIEGQVATLKNVDKMERKQLILCKKPDGKLYRGQIVQIEGAKIHVELLDYYEKVQVSASDIKQLNDTLSLEPTTYLMSPFIKGFKELTEKGRNFIRNLITDLKEPNAKKPTVILEGADFDLQLLDGRLSTILTSLEGKDILTLNDMKQYKPPLGKEFYMLYSLKNNGEVTLISGTELGEHIGDVMISEIDSEDHHVPILDEICLGLCQGSWSRCVVTRVMTSRFEVRFIDFGNVEILNSEQLRKCNKDTAKTPILGVPCILVGLPQQKNIMNLLLEHFDDGEIYELNVKRFDAINNRYEIEVPDLYEKISG